MTAPSPAERPTPRLRRAAAASVALHLALLAVPAALWRAVMPGPTEVQPPGCADADFLVVSLADAPSPSSPPAEAAASAPEVLPPRPPEEPSAAESRELSVSEPVPGGVSGEGSEVDGSPGAQGAGEVDDGIGGGSSARYQPPRLLAGALPLTPQESEALPSPLEIPVRLRIGRDGRVTAVEPADPALSTKLREALERSAQTMRFVPARLGADPVEAWFAMTFVYRR
jgi:protein TonB